MDVVIDSMGKMDFRIHCFEPMRRLFDDLLREKGGDSRVVLNSCGLGREIGPARLYYDSVESGGSLSKRRLDYRGIEYGLSEEVAIDTVDHYCDEHGIERIHLLKADVEGHELDLFYGARSMFQRGAVKAATFEFGGCNIDKRTYLRDYHYFFRSMGMELYRVTPSGYLHRLEGYNEMDEQFRTTNFAAFSPPD